MFTFSRDAHFSRVYSVRLTLSKVRSTFLGACRSGKIVARCQPDAPRRRLQRRRRLVRRLALKAMKASNRFRLRTRNREVNYYYYSSTNTSQPAGELDPVKTRFGGDTRVFQADNNRKSNGKRATDVGHSSIWQRSADRTIPLSRDTTSFVRARFPRDVALYRNHGYRLERAQAATLYHFHITAFLRHPTPRVTQNSDFSEWDVTNTASARSRNVCNVFKKISKFSEKYLSTTACGGPCSSRLVERVHFSRIR